MEQSLIEIVEFFKELSPEIWVMLIKQTYMEAIAKLLWCIPWGIFAYILYNIRNIGSEIDNDGGELAVKCVVWFIISLFALIIFGQIISSIMWFVNPEFYAFRFLLREIMPN